jgi:hypothetical protein
MPDGLSGSASFQAARAYIYGQPDSATMTLAQIFGSAPSIDQNLNSVWPKPSGINSLEFTQPEAKYLVQWFERSQIIAFAQRDAFDMVSSSFATVVIAALQAKAKFQANLGSTLYAQDLRPELWYANQSVAKNSNLPYRTWTNQVFYMPASALGTAWSTWSTASSATAPQQGGFYVNNNLSSTGVLNTVNNVATVWLGIADYTQTVEANAYNGTVPGFAGEYYYPVLNALQVYDSQKNPQGVIGIPQQHLPGNTTQRFFPTAYYIDKNQIMYADLEFDLAAPSTSAGPVTATLIPIGVNFVTPTIFTQE